MATNDVRLLNAELKIVLQGDLIRDIYNRLDELEGKLQRDREESMRDMCKMFEQLSTAHDALCDVVITMQNMIECLKAKHWKCYVENWKAVHDGLSKARLPQEAQHNNHIPTQGIESEDERRERDVYEGLEHNNVVTRERRNMMREALAKYDEAQKGGE